MDNAPKNRPIDDLNNPREPEIDQTNEVDDMNDLGADARVIGGGRHGMEGDVATGNQSLGREELGSLDNIENDDRSRSGRTTQADFDEEEGRQDPSELVGEQQTTNE